MNLEFSFRKTRKWSGYGKYDGSLARIYLPHFAFDYINSPSHFEYAVNDLFTGGPDFVFALVWLIIHELCHNIGIRHTKQWTSNDIP